MTVAIRYGAININLAADNAGLANGQNQGFGWNSHLKQNQALRMQDFFCPTPGNFNYVNDSDVIDFPIFDADFTAGTLGQSV